LLLGNIDVYRGSWFKEFSDLGQDFNGRQQPRVRAILALLEPVFLRRELRRSCLELLRCLEISLAGLKPTDPNTLNEELFQRCGVRSTQLGLPNLELLAQDFLRH
jgi:hypothetical protein